MALFPRFHSFRSIGRAVCMIAAAVWLSACMAIVKPAPEKPSWQPPPEAIARPVNLPPIGKWMFDPQYEPAHWLGEIYREKQLREPINVIVVDTVARTAEEARRRLVENCERAGYPVREGHSGGYRGFIGGIVYAQLPERGEAAFSNEPFEINNNHGRFFGPHPHGNGWLFIGAFSRESVGPLARVKHRYASFNQARDDLAQKLDAKSDLRIVDFVDLGNALIGDETCSSGDHDGVAVLLASPNP